MIWGRSLRSPLKVAAQDDHRNRQGRSPNSFQSPSNLRFWRSPPAQIAAYGAQHHICFAVANGVSLAIVLRQKEIMNSSALNERIVIIAGPNGAGKTTFAREFLPTDADCPNFVNADLIAAGLSPFAPDVAAFKAGRIMLETIADYAKRGESFSFETTLSGLTYAQMIPVWRASGYAVKLIFLSLPDVEIAIERVATRVIQGGHNVPEEFIRRRFAHGIANFERYKLLVDSWQLYDNSDAPPVLLDERQYK